MANFMVNDGIDKVIESLNKAKQADNAEVVAKALESAAADISGVISFHNLASRRGGPNES